MAAPADVTQLLSAEEVLALLQGLNEENSQPLPAVIPDIRVEERLMRRHLLDLKWLSHWLTGFTNLRWPQL
jgi:hypothetical protein